MSDLFDLDAQAAEIYFSKTHLHASFLHDWVAQQMAQRLHCFSRLPESWIDWAMRSKGPQSLQAPVKVLGMPPLPLALWPETSVDLIWSNLQLHIATEPEVWLFEWQQRLKEGQGVMLSMLGPRSFHEIQRLYHDKQWGPPCSRLREMHEWGDFFVEQGWSDPVIDVQEIVLTYSSAAALWNDCRLWGRNCSAQRYSGLRTPSWKQVFLNEIEAMKGPDGLIAITVEVIYIHAIKAQENLTIKPETRIDLEQMKKQLRRL